MSKFNAAFWQWFGNSQLTDAHGQPQILYHQTLAENVESIERQGFNTNLIDNRLSDHEMPDGIFLKHHKEDLGLGKGKAVAQIPLYARMEYPAYFENREQMVKTIKKLSDKYADMQFDYTENNRERQREFDELFSDKSLPYSQKKPLLDELLGVWVKETDTLASSLRKEALRTLKAAGHDGAIINHDEGTHGRSTMTYVVFSPRQVKSVDNNDGSYDEGEPSIRSNRGRRR